MWKQNTTLEVAHNLGDLREEFLKVEDDHIVLHNLGYTDELCWGPQTIPTEMKRLEAQRCENTVQAEWNSKDKMILATPT